MTAVEPRPSALRRGRLDPDALARLEEERDFLLTSLRDLDREHDAGDLEDDDYHALKDGYTKRAADVLRAIDEGHAAKAPRVRRSPVRVVLTVAVALLVAVGAGLLVARSAGQRLPGASASGDVAESANTLLAEARSLQASDPMSAITRYEKVLKLEPNNAEALTYLGWLRIQVGYSAQQRGLSEGQDLVTRGESSLDQAIATSPKYADAYCFKAITRFRLFGDAAAAKPAVDTCLANNPPQVVKGLVQNLQGEIDAALGGGGTSVPATAPNGTTPSTTG